MKFVVLSIQSSKEVWFVQACHEFLNKIKRYQQIDLLEMKSVRLGRAVSDNKVKLESDLILSQISHADLVVLFDQNGKSYTSNTFSVELEKLKLHGGSKRIVFIIGGAFGVNAELKKRADLIVSLSTMVMNHHVAQVVVLEQIYRAICIEKNLPYHNP